MLPNHGMMLPDQIAAIQHRLDLYLYGDTAVLETDCVEDAPGVEPQPQFVLDIADLLQHAEAADERIRHLIALGRTNGVKHA